MPINVLIAAEDLEVLLMATGVVKTLEHGLTMVTQDEQWKGAQPKITEVHNRLAYAWREAVRKAQNPDRSDRPNQQELVMLRGLVKAGASDELGMEVDRPHLYRQMVARGLVKIGVHQHRVVWMSGEVTTTQGHKQRLKLTDHAAEILAEQPREPTPRGLFGWLGRK